MRSWKPIETLPLEYKDGRDLLLHVDWEPLTIIGYWGSGMATDGQNLDPHAALYDDGSPIWRVKWDESPIHWGFDEPTHWDELPLPINNE